MATKLVKYSGTGMLMPSMRLLVKRCRAFSSASDILDAHIHDPTDESTNTQTVWPDHLLGPLGPQDKRFPMPGRIGPCVTPRRLRQIIDINSLPPPAADPVNALPKLPSQRHVDIVEQFLTSLDESVPFIWLRGKKPFPNTVKGWTFKEMMVDSFTWECAQIDVDFIDRGISYLTASDITEYRAYSCPQLLRKEFKELFPDKSIVEGILTVVTVCLKTENDMAQWSADMEKEREQLLEMFIQSAVAICQTLEESGHWADFVDPSSGKPFKGPHTSNTLYETDDRYRKLGFAIDDLGCCKVINHPVWGSHTFVGSLFTSAPMNHPLVVNLTN